MSSVMNVVYALIAWDVTCIVGVLKWDHNRSRDFNRRMI